MVYKVSFIGPEDVGSPDIGAYKNEGEYEIGGNHWFQLEVPEKSMTIQICGLITCKG